MTFSYLRLLADDRCEWIDHAKRLVRRGPDDEFEAADGQAWAVLVPAEDVLVTEMQLPVKQRHKLIQAAPFAIEDQLVGELDRYHICVGRTFEGHRHLVAAVEKSRMDAWLTRLEALGIAPQILMPDALAVPFDGTATLVGDGERALLRRDPFTIFAGTGDELNDILALLEVDELRIVGEVHGEPPQGMEIERVRPKEPTGRVLEAGLGEGVDLNLLQGPYGVEREHAGRGRKLATWAAGFALAAVLVGTADLTVRQVRGSQRIAELEAMNTQTLTSAFPEVTRVVDARVQMLQQLDELRRQAGHSGTTGFLAALREAGPALAQSSKVQLLSISYRRGELICDFRGPDLSSIESLRQELRSAGLTVDLQSATTLEDRAEARMKIVP